jgi:hypothetical protein
MKKLPERVPSNLPRRHWLVIAVSALAGCGGGSGVGIADSSTSSSGDTGAGSVADPGASGDGTQVAGLPGTGGTGAGAEGALPGTGGTGIFSHGSISAFGSVVLNGIHFDERSAKIQIDGSVASSGALRLGMVAGVQGERNSDGVTGRADSIEVWSIARGVVTATQAGQFTVLGMTIQPKGSTFLEGLSSAAAIAVGQTVAVWGLQADAQASVWSATRVAVVSASGSVIATGIVSGAAGQRTLNGIALSGSIANDLHTGRITRVAGVWDPVGNTLVVQSKYSIDLRGQNVAPSSLVEIEGVVTSLGANRQFTLGSVSVDGNAIASADYGQLRVGLKLEVYGRWQGQTLVATELELEDD